MKEKIKILTSVCPHCGYTYQVKRTFEWGVIGHDFPIVGGIAPNDGGYWRSPAHTGGPRIIAVPEYGDKLVREEVLNGDTPFKAAQLTTGDIIPTTRFGVVCPKCFRFFRRSEVETEA